MNLQTIIVVQKLDDPRSNAVNRVLHTIKLWCYAQDITLRYHQELQHPDVVRLDNVNNDILVVAIGGDGTVIYAAEHYSYLNAPVMGFNLGKVGFLADFEPSRVIESLMAVQEGLLYTESRATLHCEFFTTTNNVISTAENRLMFSNVNALNDVVISGTESDTTLTYDMYIDNMFAGTHSANGVIVSTPTGSTAYALSAGGSIIMPNMEVLQVVAIAPMTLTSRPIVIPKEHGIRICFSVTPNKPVTIRVDGNKIHTFSVDTIEESFNATVHVLMSPTKVNLIHHHTWNHFDILKQKLGWA